MDSPLSLAQRARIRRLSAPGEVDPSEGGGELNVVPFLDIIMNVLLFVLATMPAVFTSSIALDEVHHGRGKGEALQLTMMVTDEGVALKTSRGSINAGCEVGGGLTVAAQGGSVDWEALKSCARKLKANPDFDAERSVTVTASNGTPYATLIRAMDAVREDSQGPLFPDARFAVVR